MKMGGAPTGWATVEGSPPPLGVTWVPEERAFNFALYAQHAARVTLLLYVATDLVTPVLACRFDHLRNKSGRVWHCWIPAAAMRGARYYAYSIDGPRSAPHYFDPDKVLFDPYARSVLFSPEFDRTGAMMSGPNAGRAPLGLIAVDALGFDWGEDCCACGGSGEPACGGRAWRAGGARADLLLDADREGRQPFVYFSRSYEGLTRLRLRPTRHVDR